MNTKKDSPKWKKFEKLVAALHKAEQEGAIVKWNEKINGRQFDVTVRFKNGLYEYLTVIECKDFGNPIKVEKVDALATKSKDAKADKAVMISTNGYQKGAKEVAIRHNISLLTLKSLKDSAPDLATSLKPIISTSSFLFVVEHPKFDYLTIPNVTGLFRSLMRDLRIVGNDFDLCPEDLVEMHLHEFSRNATSSPQQYEIYFTVEAELIHPNTLGRYKVKSMIFEYVLITNPELGLEDDSGYSNNPYLSEDIYQLKDELNKDSKFVDFSKINLGFDTVLEAEKFYINPNLQFSYYCFEIKNDIAVMCLIESLKHNPSIQATFEIELSSSAQFIEIKDTKEILRLGKILEEYKRHFNLK